MTGVIDCDIHNEFTNYVEDILPYLHSDWRHYITNGGFRGVAMRPFAIWQGGERKDTRFPDGRKGSSTYESMRKLHLDEWNIEYGILTGSVSSLAVNYLGQPDWASALASATNDWTMDRWLGKDARLKGSIVVSAQHPEKAAREIDRCAENPDVVQVIFPTRSPATGAWADERYDPIWRAVERNDLVAGFHIALDGGNVPAPTTAGWPRSYFEASAGCGIPAQSELLAFLCRGTFIRFPGLRVAMLENGFGWFPSLLWRLDQHWRELRAELPWLKRKPSEYAREHVKFSTQPIEEPFQARDLAKLIDLMGSDEYLMFSSDFPHWNFDSPERSLPPGLSQDVRQKILTTDARDFYRLG